jgi:hypothetical protein
MFHDQSNPPESALEECELFFLLVEFLTGTISCRIRVIDEC